MNLSAVILAGGESRRMARDKAWVEFEGVPLVARALETARALAVEQVFISGRPGGDYAGLGCPVLFDLEPGFGPLGGIERGLHEMPTPLLLVLAVDLPLMTAAFLRRLAARCDPLTGVVPVLEGRLEPLAAIYSRRCHALAARCLTRNCRPARDFAADCLRERAVRRYHVSAADAPCFTNLNTPADLDRRGPVPDPKREARIGPAASGRR